MFFINLIMFDDLIIYIVDINDMDDLVVKLLGI
jgi:hypothetical protein